MICFAQSGQGIVLQIIFCSNQLFWQNFVSIIFYCGIKKIYILILMRQVFKIFLYLLNILTSTN